MKDNEISTETNIRTLRIVAIASMLAFLALGSGIAHSAFVERPDWAGLYFNSGRSTRKDLSPYTTYIRGEAGRLTWRDLEPIEGVFDWSRLDEVLTRALNEGYYYYFALWTGPHCPEWVFNRGVSKVTTETSGPYPYYLDPDYLPLISALFDALAAHIDSLPANLRGRLAFIQPGFGSTGDRQLYKATPTAPQYKIDSNEYAAIMQKFTLAWHEAFERHGDTRNIKFLWNINDYRGIDPEKLIKVSDRVRGEMLYAAWMHANYDTQLRKQQFTIAIGYNANKETELDSEQRASFFGLGGLRPDFVRGEHNDVKWAVTPMALQNLYWHYYWTAVASVDRGLDMWEVKDWETLSSREHEEAFKFSNRYSYHKKAGDSPYAFIALRDVLDSSDESRFPAGTYGSPVEQNNKIRISNVVADYSSYGAAVEDITAAATLAKADYLLNSQGLNDVGWKVIARNYRRFITQINPNGTSVGLWRVGPANEPYGRYARAFENSSGKNAMYFKFDDGFFSGPTGSVTIKVIYKDQPAGSTWDLEYDAGAGNFKKAYTVTNTRSNTWKTKTITVTDAVMAHNGPNGADIALINSDSLDDVFHMIEIERTVGNSPD